jgi:heptosyltransferase-2
MVPREISVVMIAPAWLGDAVMSLPLVGFLAGAQDVRLTVIARERTGRVYLGVEGVGDLVVPRDGGRLARIWRVREVLRTIRPDGAVVLPPSFSAALACYLGGVGARGGFATDARGALLDPAAPARGLRDEHLSESYLRLGRLLLERLGVPGDHPHASPRARVFAGERESAFRRLRASGIEGDYALVVPGATYGPTKAWPSGKYRELVRQLSQDIAVVVGGARGERELCASVVEGARGVANFAGETALGEFMALLEKARVVVANDSGAPHLAASLGAPVVVIFGSTSPDWTAPVGQEVYVVIERVHCSPCFLRNCPTKLECYDGITVERVLETARRALRKGFEKRGSG